MSEFTTITNRFDGGIVNDPRDTRVGVCRICTNFDALSNLRRLVPYRDSEDGDGSASTSQKQNFAIALRTGTTYSLYALGVILGSGKAEVLRKELTTGAGTDLDDNGWATPSKNQSSSGAVNFELFLYYKLAGLILGGRAGTHIWAFSPTGSDWQDTFHALTYSTLAEGLVHSKDDIAYIAYDNKIASYDHSTTTWNDTALTVPNHLKINSIAEYGNYIAVTCVPLSGVGHSIVFLWDRDSSLATLSESIDWGSGECKVMETIDGVLTGISVVGSGTDRFKAKIVVRQYLGATGAVPILKLHTESKVVTLTLGKQKEDDRLYFQMSITLNGSIREGVWSIGRESQTSRFTLVHERTPNNDTALTGGVLKNFFIYGDYMFQSQIDNSNYTLTKTNDQSSYTASSVYETVINPDMRPEFQKTEKVLKAIAISYDKLPADGQVVLKYKVDGGSYITIFTETTDDSMFTEAVIDTNGEQFDSGREYEYRTESTGGAEITEIRAVYDTLDTELS